MRLCFNLKLFIFLLIVTHKKKKKATLRRKGVVVPWCLACNIKDCGSLGETCVTLGPASFTHHKSQEIQKYRVFLSSHLLISLSWEEMKLWKTQVNLCYFTSPCSHLSFCSLELQSLPQFEVVLFSPALASHLLAPLLAVPSPVVLLCSSSATGPAMGREALGAVASQPAQGSSGKRGQGSTAFHPATLRVTNRTQKTQIPPPTQAELWQEFFSPFSPHR